ncbi:hypothetical protein D3C76_1499310 [compost metagenome]
MYFEEALGEDEVDYAIYMLEAAERKYQMHLKKAKKYGINRIQLSGNHATWSRKLDDPQSNNQKNIRVEGD